MNENELVLEWGTVVDITPNGTLQVTGQSGNSYPVYRQNAADRVEIGDRGALYQVSLPAYSLYRFVKEDGA